MSFLACLSACGKSGEPHPRANSRAFVWQEINARPALPGCLEIYGRLSGAYTNLDAVFLEISVESADRNCQDCPFRVDEKISLDYLGGIFDAGKGEIRFIHCPQVPAYRMRLTGINVFEPSRLVHSMEISVPMP